MALTVVVLSFLIGGQLWMGLGRYQEIRVSFPRHITWDPVADNSARCPSFTEPGFFAHRAADCGPIEHRNGGVPDGSLLRFGFGSPLCR
jgi:hypothetical protein